MYRSIVLLIATFIMFDCVKADDCIRSRKNFWFANGMFTSRDSANDTVLKVKKKFHSKFNRYNIAYNHNESIGLQLLEVFYQKISSKIKYFWKWSNNLSEAPQWYKLYVEKVIVTHSKIRAIVDDDLKNHVRMYFEDLRNGYDIVTLSHSQGNFYTNEAFEIIQEKTPFKKMLNMVSVATPDSYVWNNGSHFTLQSDYIHKVPLALNWNIANDNPRHRGHYIKEHYLSGSPSSELIYNSLDVSGSSDLHFLSDDYLHFSFDKFSQWLRIYESLGDQRPKLNKMQCLAINLFVYHVTRSDISCEKRTFAALDGFYSEHASIYKDPKYSTFPLSLYGVSRIDSGTGGAIGDYQTLFFNQSHCKLSVQDEFEAFKTDEYKDALKFVHNPDFEILYAILNKIKLE